MVAFVLLKGKLLAATLQSIDKNMPFVVECDASDVAISALSNQGTRPVVFMSKIFQGDFQDVMKSNITVSPWISQLYIYIYIYINYTLTDLSWVIFQDDFKSDYYSVRFS